MEIILKHLAIETQKGKCRIGYVHVVPPGFRLFSSALCQINTTPVLRTWNFIFENVAI